MRGKVHCAPSARIPSEQEKEVFFVHVLDEMKLLCYSVKVNSYYTLCINKQMAGIKVRPILMDTIARYDGWAPSLRVI